MNDWPLFESEKQCSWTTTTKKACIRMVVGTTNKKKARTKKPWFRHLRFFSTRNLFVSEQSKFHDLAFSLKGEMERRKYSTTLDKDRTALIKLDCSTSHCSDRDVNGKYSRNAITVLLKLTSSCERNNGSERQVHRGQKWQPRNLLKDKEKTDFLAETSNFPGSEAAGPQGQHTE